MKKYKLFIDGEFVSSPDQEYFTSINPYSGEAWAEIPQSSVDQVQQSVRAARRAFEGAWGRVSGFERGKLLNSLADLLFADGDRMGRLETTDNGKVIRETRSQMDFAARQYRFFAGYADKLWGNTIPLDRPNTLDYTIRTPAGVCVLINAWNSPIGQLSNKLAPALAAGNCVIIKPSEHASATTLEFAKFVKKAGFPAGVINVVTGDAEVGKALLQSGRIDRVSFTGSPEVGRKIAANAGRALVPVTMELGGKSPNIIFDDADLKKACTGALAGIFAATGQTCIAGSRLLVQQSVYDHVVQNLAERAKAIKMGDPLEKVTEMGPAANLPQFDRILNLINVAKNEGAELVVGGERGFEAELESGYFVKPTIFSNVKNSMQIAQTEVFGPVLSVIPFDDEAEAVSIANDTNFGLAAGIWTTNINRAMRLSSEVNAGTVWVNTYRSIAVQAPFGGYKDSGYGRERGEVALNEFTNTKNVMIDFSDDERDPFAIKL